MNESQMFRKLNMTKWGEIEGEFHYYSKKQSQFIRAGCRVVRIAKRNLKKQSQFSKGRNERKLNYSKGL